MPGSNIISLVFIAPQALLWEREAEKECRRSSIKQVLRRIGGSDQGPRFEAFRERLPHFECQKWVRRASRSSSNLCADAEACLKLCFFLSRFCKYGLLVVETRKSQSKKWIAPVMWPRTVPNLGPEPGLVKKMDHRHWNPNWNYLVGLRRRRNLPRGFILVYFLAT